MYDYKRTPKFNFKATKNIKQDGKSENTSKTGNGAIKGQRVPPPPPPKPPKPAPKKKK